MIKGTVGAHKGHSWGKVTNILIVVFLFYNGLIYYLKYIIKLNCSNWRTGSERSHFGWQVQLLSTSL